MLAIHDLKGGENMKTIINLTTIVLLFVITMSNVSAHVVVRPKEVGVGTFQTFTIGVPVEKEVPTTGLRLVIPEGLNHVTPNVKPGWTISLKKSGEGEEAKVTEISWEGGSIPSGQRDDFFFSAQVPSDETTVSWKAYQTYQDGSIVAWDQNPTAASDEEMANIGPYSETEVVNDLATTSDESEEKDTSSTTPVVISVLALILAGIALGMQIIKKKK